MRLFIGNLPYSVDEEALHELVSEFATVGEVTMPIDRESGRVRGYGFVDVADAAEAQSVIENLNDYELGGRRLAVNPAKPKGSKPGGTKREDRHDRHGS